MKPFGIKNGEAEDVYKRQAYNPALRRSRMAERKGCPPPLSQEGILCFNVLTGDYVCNS